jgi:hypothetical protein
MLDGSQRGFKSQDVRAYVNNEMWKHHIDKANPKLARELRKVINGLCDEAHFIDEDVLNNMTLTRLVDAGELDPVMDQRGIFLVKDYIGQMTKRICSIHGYAFKNSNERVRVPFTRETKADNAQQPNTHVTRKKSGMNIMHKLLKHIKYSLGPDGTVVRQYLYMVIVLVCLTGLPKNTPQQNHVVRDLLFLLGLIFAVIADLAVCSVYAVYRNVRHPERVPLTVERILELVLVQLTQAGYDHQADDVLALKHQLQKKNGKYTAVMPRSSETSLALLCPWLIVNFKPLVEVGSDYITVEVALLKNTGTVTYERIQGYGAVLPSPTKTCLTSTKSVTV